MGAQEIARDDYLQMLARCRDRPGPLPPAGDG
jgi:hypothetical protein